MATLFNSIMSRPGYYEPFSNSSVRTKLFLGATLLLNPGLERAEPAIRRMNSRPVS
jgi:hypothetical protein